MSLLLFADCYGTPRTWGAQPSTVTVAAPSGGTVAVDNVDALRDTVLAKPATIRFEGLPAASGARAGRFGPITLTSTGPAHAWSGSAIALLGHTLPARTRVELSFGAASSPPADVLVGQDFQRARPGVIQNLAFYAPTMAFGGYLNLVATPDQQLRISLYMPFGTGQFTIGRLFVGHAVDLTSVLDAAIDDAAEDYAVAGTPGSGLSRRQRGVARQLKLSCSIRPGTVLQGLGRVWAPVELLSRLALDPSVVFWPTATLSVPAPNSDHRLACGVLQPPLSFTDAMGNAGALELQLLETL